MSIDVLIMAGGSGTRLWPRSRATRPKQFLPLLSEKTMLQETVDRVRPLVPPERIYIVTGAEYAGLAAEQVPDIPRRNIIAEPSGQGTAPAIGLAALYMRRANPNGIMAVLSADHLIRNDAAFRRALQAAATAADQGFLVTLGITPSFPNTGYGYIQRGDELTRSQGLEIYHVARFAEKPDLATAQRYLAEGGYYWNAGIFIWRTETILAAIDRFLPHLYRQLIRIEGAIGTPEESSVIEQAWAGVQNTTIDYGVMERADKVAVVPVDIGWSDVGDWHTLTALMSEDESANVIIGPHVTVDTSGSLIYSDSGRIIATIGLEHFLVVDTHDAVLIAPRSRAQDVKKIVDQLRREGRSDVL
ncbi:MAG: mannose-1-phosphate guanylyltransferase [Herpetosiphonaceae bacterium]|nr:MAG: mannose-1-phosphate guanylyltransferase [Herpetosiphonaceae bacterium]